MHHARPRFFLAVVFFLFLIERAPRLIILMISEGGKAPEIGSWETPRITTIGVVAERSRKNARWKLIRGAKGWLTSPGRPLGPRVHASIRTHPPDES
jgi:hypothetical protein